MKSTILIFSLLFLFILNTIHAQIEQEIKAYTDSSELIINNGRKMLINNIENENYHKAQEIYDYLKSRNTGNTYYPFYYSEELMITILTEDWTDFLELAENCKELSQNRCYSNTVNIFNPLRKNTEEKLEELTIKLKNKEITQEGKDLIALYLYIFDKNNTDNEYSRQLSVFKKNYPSSVYNDFINYVLPSKYIKGAIAFSGGSGINIPTGNLTDYFSTRASYNFSLYFNINKVYCSLYFNGSTHALEKSFSGTLQGNTEIFEKNENFVYTEGGLKGGYFLARNQSIQFAPFVNIGGASINSTRFDDEDDENDEFSATNSFLCGGGLHTEVIITDFNKDDKYKPMPSYLSLKLDLGYNYLTKTKHEIFKGNIAYCSFALVYGIGEF